MPIIFPKREKRVQLVFVIHPKSPRLLEFKHIFEETKRIIWSKCRPDQFIRHNLPVNFSKDSDYIYLIETESVDAQVAQCQATLETCVLVEDDLVFLQNSLLYFDRITHSNNYPRVVLHAFTFFMLCQIQDISTLMPRLNRVLEAEHEWLYLTMPLLIALNLADDGDLETLQGVRPFLAVLVGRVDFYLSFLSSFHLLHDNTPLIRYCFMQPLFIEQLRQDQHHDRISKCKAVAAELRPDLLHLFDLPKQQPSVISNVIVLRKLGHVTREQLTFSPIPSPFVSISVHRIKDDLLNQLDRYPHLRLLTIETNTDVPERKTELQLDWFTQIFEHCPQLEILDVSHNKIASTTLEWLNSRTLKKFTKDNITRIRFPVTDVNNIESLLLQQLLFEDHLFALSAPKLLNRLKSWFKKTNYRSFYSLISHPDFLTVLFEVDALGDSIFRRWAMHETGLELLRLAFKHPSFYFQLLLHAGFWTAFHHVYTEKGVSTSPLFGLCHEADLFLLTKIVIVLDPEVITDTDKMAVFTASVTPSNYSEFSSFEQSAITALKRKFKSSSQDVIKRFRDIFVPGFYRDDAMWLDNNHNDTQSQRGSAHQDLKCEPGSESVKVGMSYEDSLLSGQTLFNKSTEKASCHLLNEELQKKSNRLLKVLVNNSKFMDVFLSIHHESVGVERTRLLLVESTLYYWVKWDSMIANIEWIMHQTEHALSMHQHPLLMRAILCISPQDQCAPLHWLFQKKRTLLLEWILPILKEKIADQPHLFLALLFYPVPTASKGLSCLLEDLSHYAEGPDHLIDSILGRENQTLLLKAFHEVSCELGRPGLVTCLERLISFYPDNVFLQTLMAQNMEQLFTALSGEALAIRALLDPTKESRKLLAAVFNLASVENAWHQFPLKVDQCERLLSACELFLLPRCDSKTEKIYLADLLKSLLSHPSISMIMSQEKDRWLKLGSWLVIGATVNPVNISSATIPSSLPIVSNSVQTLITKPYTKKSSKKKTHISSTTHVVPSAAEDFLDNTSLHMRGESSSQALRVDVVNREREECLQKDSDSLAVNSTAELIFQLALNASRQVFMRIPSASLSSSWCVMKSSAEVSAAIDVTIEEKCLQKVSLANLRDIKRTIENGRCLFLAHLLREGICFEELSFLITECMGYLSSSSDWLIQTVMVALSVHYRLNPQPVDPSIKRLFVKYFSISQDVVFLKGLLKSIMHQGAAGFGNISTKLLEDAERLIESKDDDKSKLDELKLYYLYLQFGHVFDLSIISKLKLILTCYNEAFVERTAKGKYRLKTILTTFFEEQLLAKSPGLPDWIHSLFLIPELLELCDDDRPLNAFVRGLLQLMQCSEAQIELKLASYDRPVEAKIIPLLASSQQSVASSVTPISLISLLQGYKEQVIEEMLEPTRLEFHEFFRHRADLQTLMEHMLGLSSSFYPCIVGGQARIATQLNACFDERKDLDFDIFLTDMDPKNLTHSGQLEHSAKVWIESLKINHLFSEYPKCLKQGIHPVFNYRWCAFKAKIGLTEIDLRFVSSTQSLAEMIQISRRERCLTWSSYLWDLPKKCIYGSSLSEQLDFVKPVSTLTTDNITYALWTIMKHPHLSRTEGFNQVIKSVLALYQSDPSVKTCIVRSVVNQFKRKLRDNFEQSAEQVVLRAIHLFYPHSQESTLFGTKPSLKVPSPSPSSDGLVKVTADDSGIFNP